MLSPSHIPSLRSGLSVAFADITYSRNAFGNVSVHGFDVILGNVLTMGAHELYEAHPTVYAEAHAMACESAEEISASEVADRRERRAWFAAR